ncbi:Aste57867_14831 [Aphanomyces stellatus]|uniref:subtilisin n=1 Tax=Aphanomyces stellatus TaxID=120398 RepID=A0A485L1Q5_9STRA|nr:hypothetical protein As57867_014775 [Aphanomyces stellatus]VFT91649.1 Aste57867_14831 [Aphanomyces stellatus]
MPKIAADVLSALAHATTVNILVEHEGSTTSGLSKATAVIQADRGCIRSQKVCTALQSQATKSQSCVARVLGGDAYTHVQRQSFWIANVMHVKHAPSCLVQALAKCAAVSAITLEPTFPLRALPPAQAYTNDVALLEDYMPQWGVDKIGAPAVWATTRGQGVVVGIIDSGVLHTHEALAGKWRSSHGWFDPQGQTLLPSDGNGHGTHVLGTILGANGIGVAPDATFVACNGCPGGTCIGSAVLACAQFLLCPTDPMGGDRNCSMHPHVINNSWGGPSVGPWFDAAIAAWRLAGIVPIFAAGNGGATCDTVTSPGDSTQAIAVGATGNGGTNSGTDELAYFSSRGGSSDDVIKPDLVAPGYFVLSAFASSESSYAYMAGTSMAAPHVTGAVALLLSRNLSATYDDVYRQLTTTAVTSTLVPTNQNCGGVADATFPNNNYGFGRVDVSRAMAASNAQTAASNSKAKVFVAEPLTLPDF